MTVVAAACLLGVPADRLVYGDTLEQVFWHAVAERAMQLDETRRDNQATANANAIAHLFRRWGGGRRAG